MDIKKRTGQLMTNVMAGAMTVTMAISFCACQKQEVENIERITIPADTVLNEPMPKAYRDILLHIDDIIDSAQYGLNQLSDEDGEFLRIFETAYVLGADEARNHIGYQLVDLNRDGTNELVIASRDNDTVMDVYTLDGDDAVLLQSANYKQVIYINSDSQFVVEGSSGAAYFDVWVYSYDDSATTLNEIYHVYNDYIEDTRVVGMYESINGSEPVEITRTDDPRISDIWDIYSDIVDQHTEELYRFNLIPLSA